MSEKYSLSYSNITGLNFNDSVSNDNNSQYSADTEKDVQKEIEVEVINEDKVEDIEEVETQNKDEVKEKIDINELELCLNLSILSFTYYVNNFPRLKNENINRLKYFFSLIYNSNIYFDKFNIDGLDKKDLQNILLKMFYNINDDQDEEFYKKTLFALLVVLFGYKMIANFISKKNIFTKDIKVKITTFTNIFIKQFNKEIVSIKQDDNSIINIINVIQKVYNNSYFEKLKFRQNFRNHYTDFIEYNDSVGDFRMFSSIKNLKMIYDTIVKKSKMYDYEKQFLAECNDFTNTFYKINVL